METLTLEDVGSDRGSPVWRQTHGMEIKDLGGGGAGLRGTRGCMNSGPMVHRGSIESAPRKESLCWWWAGKAGTRGEGV